MNWIDFFWIISVTILVGAIVALSGSGCDEGNNTTPVVPIDYSYMMGASPNYCMFGANNYKELIDYIAEHKINMTRIWIYAGWGDVTGSYVYKPWIGNDVTNIDQNVVNKIREVCKYANSKGIIVILGLFHRNGDPYSYVVNENGERLRVLIQAIVNATKDLQVIYEPLNEDIDPGFNGFVQSEIRLIKPDAKTCFYSCDGGTYRIEHTGAKNYIGARRIQSTDTPQLVNVNNGDMYNIAKVAKEQEGHTEFLLFWKRQGGGVCNTPSELELEWGGALDLLKGLR